MWASFSLTIYSLMFVSGIAAVAASSSVLSVIVNYPATKITPPPAQSASQFIFQLAVSTAPYSSNNYKTAAPWGIGNTTFAIHYSQDRIGTNQWKKNIALGSFQGKSKSLCLLCWYLL